MADKTTERKLLLKYAVEQATLAKVKSANEQIKQSMLDIGKAAKTGGTVGVGEFKRLGKEANQLERELLDVRSGFDDIGDDAPKELQDVIDKVDQLNKSVKRGSDELRDFDAEFSQVSKDVALAGDVESQARTVGGAIGAVGGAGVERGISTVSELPAVIEALPKLKSSLVGMPAAIKSGATALGPTGVGLIAVVLAAGVAFAKVAGDIAKQTAQMQGLVDAQADYFEVVATGTVQVAEARIKDAQATNAVAQAELDALRIKIDAAKQTVSQADIISQAAVGLGDVFLETPINVMEDRAKELSTTINSGNSTISQFTRGLEQNAFATETAADTLARLNQEEMERNTILLAGAEEIKASTINQRELMRQSTEQLDAALLAIDDKALGLLASLQALKAIENPTDEILAQIAAEEERFAGLREERAFILSSAKEAAAIRESEASSLEDQAKASEEAERAAQDRIDADRKTLEIIRKTLEERAELERKHADELIALSERAAEAEQKVLDNFQDKLADLNKNITRDMSDLQRKQQRKLLEAQVESQRKQVQQFRDHVRSLEDIRRKADENEVTLRQSRDFKGVANARRTARISIQDAQRDFTRKQSDTAEQLAQEAEDRQRAFAEERQDRLRKFQQDLFDARSNFIRQRNEAIIAGRQAIMDARAKHQQELSDQQAAGLQRLQVQKQISDVEIKMLQNVADAAVGFFQQLASFQAQATGDNSTTTTTSSSIANNVNVDATSQDDGDGIGRSVLAALGELVA